MVCLMNSVISLLLLQSIAFVIGVNGGSCSESTLCCNGRDSSCVVQKAPINAIIEDLSDKPCYCDHACLKLGDCCSDFKQYCGGKLMILVKIIFKFFSFIYRSHFCLGTYPNVSLK